MTTSMQYKKITIIILTAISLFLSPLAHAQTVSPTLTQNQTDRITKLHTQCDTDINKRLADLNTALQKVTDLVKLTTDQKSQFSQQISINIVGLTNLMTKCDADTNLSTLRSDYTSVFTQYRIYAVFLPQLHILITTDDLGVTADMQSHLINKLQTRIQAALNPSTLTALLADMQTKITDAHAQYNSASSLVSALTPQSFNTNKQGTEQTFSNARIDITAGQTDMKTAYQDAKQIIQGLRLIGNTSISAFPTPTP